MTKYCTDCGAPIEEGKQTCDKCGAPAPDAQTAQAAPETSQAVPQSEAPRRQPTPVERPAGFQSAPEAGAQVAYQAPPQSAFARPERWRPEPDGETEPPYKSKYEPITAGGYVGIALLMAIPGIGLLLTIIWALGGCRKVNKRNLARAALVLLLFSVLISLIAALIFRETLFSFLESSGLMNGQNGPLDNILSFGSF